MHNLHVADLEEQWRDIQTYLVRFITRRNLNLHFILTIIAIYSNLWEKKQSSIEQAILIPISLRKMEAKREKIRRTENHERRAYFST